MALNISEMEKKWLSYWEKEKIYKFDLKTKKKIYSIDTPPPTVSGAMHMGHAYSYAQEDFIARYKRMSGFEVFYPFGTDDNGLPTERLIEKIKNVKSKSISRQEFIKLCLKTLEEIRPEFVLAWKNLGVSCDYSIFYSTIDKNSQKLSQKSFIELYKKGEIYREEKPTIFCPECQTPIAQAELEDKVQESEFNTVVFKVGENELLIATTRPELLGACVGVFVNPHDKRYKNLIGKTAKVPLYNHEVKIFGDEAADMKKGTGALMVCSYGDKYDVDAVKRFKLNSRIVFNSDGTLRDVRYGGMKIKEARKKIIEDLAKTGLLKERKNITHSVNVHDKCGTEIEFLPVEQWFVKILDKKSKLIQQGKKIKWLPGFMFKRYENWIKGLEWDWSISRERHFGIPLPLWNCKNCKEVVLADEKELPIDPVEIGLRRCSRCGSDAKPENKVLDTWATSSLTPQIASSLVSGKVRIPYSLRPQAHDIIRTWAFYTIVKSLLHENKIPWEEIAVSGFSTLEGKKMSKSKGNVVSPLEVMEKYGADSLRYWAASQKLGEDAEYTEKDLISGKKFVTKIMNAANFVFLNLKNWDAKRTLQKPAKFVETDRLFLSMLNKLIENATVEFDKYNYSKVKSEIENFFWKNFADNYLEIVKYRVYNGNAEEKASAFYSLYNSLLVLLKLFAPFTPFICEEIYQKYFRKIEGKRSVHLETWPSRIGIREERHDTKMWDKLVDVISRVRQVKSENKRAMNTQIYLTLLKEDLKILEKVLDDLERVCCVEGGIKQGKFEVRFV